MDAEKAKSFWKVHMHSTADATDLCSICKSQHVPVGVKWYATCIHFGIRIQQIQSRRIHCYTGLEKCEGRQTLEHTISLILFRKEFCQLIRILLHVLTMAVSSR